VASVAAHDNDIGGRIDLARHHSDVCCGRRKLGERPQRRNARDAAIGFRCNHILRECQMRNAAARVGSRDRLMNDSGRLRRGGNGFGIETDIAEKQIRLGRLDIVDPAQLARHVAGKGKDRRMVAGCLIKAGDKVRAAGTRRARTHAEAAGQLGLPRSGERCSLLMPDADPLYLATANRVAQRVQRIADQAENLPNPDLFEHTDQHVCYHLGHLSLLRCCDRRHPCGVQKMNPAKNRRVPQFRA
jgi:hypothetical protein